MNNAMTGTMNVPTWWLVLSGVFFAAFIVVSVASVWLVLILIQTLKDLSVQVKALAEKTEQIADRVNGLVQNVHNTASIVGANAGGISRSIATVAGGLAGRVDTLATVFLVASFLRRFFGSRRG